MKGIVLAGGLGTRLHPFTKILNKHVLPIQTKPMFFYPLQTLIDSSVKEIAVVSGPPFGYQVKELLKYFKTPKDTKIHFILQKKPTGMPDAINKCKKFIGNDSVIVVAGDNIFEGFYTKEVKSFKTGAVSFLRKVSDPTRFAVPKYDKSDRLVKIIEKPKKASSNLAITGPHIFDQNVFKFIKSIKPSKRGELEITDLLALYLNSNNLKLVKRDDYWLDVGTFEAFSKASLNSIKIKPSSSTDFPHPKYLKTRFLKLFDIKKIFTIKNIKLFHQFRYFKRVNRRKLRPVRHQ